MLMSDKSFFDYDYLISKSSDKTFFKQSSALVKINDTLAVVTYFGSIVSSIVLGYLIKEEPNHNQHYIIIQKNLYFIVHCATGPSSFSPYSPNGEGFSLDGIPKSKEEFELYLLKKEFKKKVDEL